MMPNISFRPLCRDDFPLLWRWLNAEHVRQFYGKKKMSLEEVAEKYGKNIKEAEPTRSYIFMVDGVDAGYIQTYRIKDYPAYNRYVQADDHAAGVDLFIGHKDYVHRGYGVLIMRAFLKGYVFDDPEVDACIIGPEPKNTIAIRMYEKVGFRWYKDIRLPDEDEPEYLMLLYKKDFAVI